MPGDSFNQTVATILAGTLAPANSPSELCYHKLWSREIAGEANPLVAAARGGALADRPAWIFQAGYQAAIHRVFGEVAPDGWLASGSGLSRLRRCERQPARSHRMARRAYLAAEDARRRAPAAQTATTSC